MSFRKVALRMDRMTGENRAALFQFAGDNPRDIMLMQHATPFPAEKCLDYAKGCDGNWQYSTGWIAHVRDDEELWLWFKLRFVA